MGAYNPNSDGVETGGSWELNGRQPDYLMSARPGRDPASIKRWRGLKVILNIVLRPLWPHVPAYVCE